MKKKIFTLFVLAMMGGSVLAGDKPVITVADVVALQGETVEFAVNLTDGKADTYTAMTLYAYFPTTTTGFTTKGNSVSDEWVGASGSTGSINAETGLATIPFASENPIPGSAVENLVKVKFEVAKTVPVGEYKVTLKGTMFEYNTSDKDYADDVTFNVIVTDRITLDETATVAPAAATGVNVKVKRTINANEWSTICLPFAMDATQVKAAFGDDVQLGDFDGIESTTDAEDNITAINVKFNAATAIEANHPYIIKVTSPITEFTADAVNIDPQDASVDKDETKVKISGKWYYFYNRFIGTYVAETPVPEINLFLSGNKFWYSKGLTKIKAFRAYFDFQDILSGVDNSSAPVFISFGSETTGIKNIQQTVGDDRYYNLNGQHVENLRKGQIYIKNNKKVVVK